MNMYIIPANSKKGQLIFNIFRGIDLVVFLTSVALSLILFISINSNSAFLTIIKIVPICMGGFLVVPLPYYHNVMVFIREAILYMIGDKKYYWKGWCVRSEFGEEK